MNSTHPAISAQLDEALAVVRQRSALTPALGIVAGSGLGAIGSLVQDAVAIPYGEIPHMYAPTVVGHAGTLLLGTLEGLPVAILSGRVHAYEGHAMHEVVFGVRLLARLGAPRVLLTNAAGGVQPWLAPGSLCRIVDHINLSGQNPLIGPNPSELGPRFPDMSTGYCPELGGAIAQAAATAGVPLFAGVYAAMSGPSYETPAEIRMLRVLGASLVGMSTVSECIALNHMGVRVGGISVVSNYAAGVSAAPLDHSEVAEVANEAGPRLLAIIRTLAGQLAAAGI
ncbi:MAG: purine-nucleoside phosphorylase [Deltaproteobacteria bacterium HGW-Deltaproteobacteria-14]|jgi:purine-nucleoside phosphorylase|nr:MAG: purine-nucleoside phosphorylase [Deltaproteobacteria bacterium HGW-Deltaproteobacteria-14]